MAWANGAQRTASAPIVRETVAPGDLSHDGGWLRPRRLPRLSPWGLGALGAVRYGSKSGWLNPVRERTNWPASRIVVCEGSGVAYRAGIVMACHP